jgi:glycerophosphoryl diester phosphodiesterase
MQGAYSMRQRLEAARAEGRIMLGGHRGNPAEHPENTLASYLSAIELGCDMVECDVHLTADGELAVIHDHQLERTTNGRGLVGAHTLAELRELDAGQGERIPLLEEVFELCRDRVGLVIETKQNPIPYPGLEEKLVAKLREHSMLQQVSVISFHHGCVRHLKEIAPELDAGIIDASRPVDPVAMLRAARAELFSCYWGTLEPSMVAELHAAGAAVGAWTVDDDLGVIWMQACRPDSVFTNRPGEIGPKLT